MWKLLTEKDASGESLVEALGTLALAIAAGVALAFLLTLISVGGAA